MKPQMKTTNATTDAVLNALRQRGERLTIQRRMVIEALAEGNDHRTIAQLQQSVEQRGLMLDNATVYRILEHFNAIGIVSRTDLGAQGIVYELMSDVPHHHLICLACGAVIHVDDSAIGNLRECLQHDFAFQPRIDHMAIFGYCHSCQENTLDS